MILNLDRMKPGQKDLPGHEWAEFVLSGKKFDRITFLAGSANHAEMLALVRKSWVIVSLTGDQQRASHVTANIMWNHMNNAATPGARSFAGSFGVPTKSGICAVLFGMILVPRSVPVREFLAFQYSEMEATELDRLVEAVSKTGFCMEPTGYIPEEIESVYQRKANDGFIKAFLS